MASSPCNSFSEPAIMEQVITEFFAKSLHIILESRSPYVSSRNYSGEQFFSSPSSSSSSSSVRPRDKWFNLALRDCPAALENFDLWRQSNVEPLVIDVILTRRSLTTDAAFQPAKGCLFRNLSSKDQFCHYTIRQDEFAMENRSEKIVERWVIQYESRKSGSVVRESCPTVRKGSSSASSHSSEIPAMYRKTYRKSIILLRSLYSTVRLLPAYKVFRDLNSSGQIRPFSLSHKIASFVEPFTQKEEAEMNYFSFGGVDTPCGRLCLSVSFLPALDDVSSEISTPLSTQFIPDYVGSPTTDPLKRFPSLPSSLPTYISFFRRHSWSNDQGGPPSISGSPSPTYSDSRALHGHPNHRRPPRQHMHDCSPSQCAIPKDASTEHRKNTSFDEYWPSPPFSPSSSPSPPTHIPAEQVQNALLRTESAPVSIPSPRYGKGNAQLNQGLPPSPSKTKGMRQGNSPQVDVFKALIPTSSPSQTSSPDSKLHLKKDLLRVGDIQTSMTLQKILSFGKDEAGTLPGLKIPSCSSPRIPFSRSSSRLSFLDEFDDSEFICPFAVDDEDTGDPCKRIETLDEKGNDSENMETTEISRARRSQDAAVGALVRMLKTAPPLRQDLSETIRSSKYSKDEPWNQRADQNSDAEDELGKLNDAAPTSGMAASGLFKSRTAADALQELQIYKEMKDSLLRQGGSQISAVALPSKSSKGD